MGGALKSGLRGIRLEGGVNPDQALARNVGTCRRDVKGTIQVGQPGEEQSTDARHRDRAARSSVDGAVMASERRGSGIQSWRVANQ